MKNKTSIGAGCFHHLLSWGYKLSSIASPLKTCDCELSWLNFKAQLVLLVAEPNHFNYAWTAIIGWCRQVSKSLTLLVDDIAHISVQFSHSFMSDSLPPHELQNARLSYPSLTPGGCSDSCPSSQWCHPTISSSVIPFSSCLQSFPTSGSFQMSQFFVSGGQNIGFSVSASVLPMNIQDWFPLELTGWISLQSKGLPRVFSNTTVQKHQFFDTQLSL